MFRADEDPEEPEIEPQSPSTPSAQAVVVAAAGTAGVAFEYRTEVLTAAQITDGKTLPEKLAQESADGWDLVDLVQAQDKYVIVLRKPKKPDRAERRVGFFSR